MFTQHFRRVAYLALARQEHQHIAAQAACRQFIQRTTDGLRNILRFAFFGNLQGTIARLDRITAPRHLDHLRAKMFGESIRIQRGGSDDEFEVGAARQQLLEIAQQKIDVERTLVRLVDDQRVVMFEQRVAVYLGQQDAVCHQLDAGIRRDLVVEAHLETDRTAELGLQFERDACRHGARRHPARLGVADAAQHTAPQRQAYLRQLRGLARPRLAAHDDDLMFGDGARQHLALADHGQV